MLNTGKQSWCRGCLKVVRGRPCAPCRFEHEAQLVLAELAQFAVLEQRNAAEFLLRVANEMGLLFVAPAAA